VFLGLVDTRKNVLHYVNAGLAPPILVRGKDGTVKLLEEGGTVIGLFPQADYMRGSVKLDPGDLLVCCTDGILRVSDEKKQEYGTGRLAEFVRSQRERSAQEVVDAVLSEIAAYPTASMNDDDKVLVVVKVPSEKNSS
jgi:sigma-B regulation protein RsbU (phosphoserine phosphatase)